MKEKIKILILIIAFIGLLVLSNIFVNNKEKEILNNETEITEEEKYVSVQNKVQYLDGVEEDIVMSNEILEVTSSTFQSEVLESEKMVLVDVYADWCGPCKRLSPIVEEVAGEVTDVKFVKLNIDDAEDIATEYQVMSIPTLIVIKDGKEVTRSVGLIDKESVKELIK